MTYYYTVLGYYSDVVQPHKNSKRASHFIPGYSAVLENSRTSNYYDNIKLFG